MNPRPTCAHAGCRIVPTGAANIRTGRCHRHPEAPATSAPASWPGTVTHLDLPALFAAAEPAEDGFTWPEESDDVDTSWVHDVAERHLDLLSARGLGNLTVLSNLGHEAPTDDRILLTGERHIFGIADRGAPTAPELATLHLSVDYTGPVPAQRLDLTWDDAVSLDVWEPTDRHRLIARLEYQVAAEEWIDTVRADLLSHAHALLPDTRD